ncbi:allantoicase [Marinobacterium lutimaris]|uniref:Probable allantoicase n=1 Tax=Marinobacterium lutimaris TaxID=568106 RepID=A0A1H5V4Z6_9GAMM|nr:allantoicase [Marinobacterium lutimaris]SEF82379.1 allantoicase [Marinobacterium lutimaris]
MEYIEGQPVETLPAFAEGAMNLADIGLGTEVVAVSDQFFAPAERMISADLPRFYPDRYDDHGKWMDGWESRRKRGVGHDWCVLRLGVAGYIHGFDIDTSFFTGNYPPGASIEACYLPESDPDDSTEWTMLAGPVTLGPSQHHLVAAQIPADKQDSAWTHVRLNILPDGGVARLVVYGSPSAELKEGDELNLAARELGARVVSWNDSHYGHPNKILMPTKGINMGDGWETRRRREPGNDWCLIELAAPGYIDEIVIDTAFFKGNFPDKCSLQAACMGKVGDEALVTQSMFWQELLSPQPLSADAEHKFVPDAGLQGPVTHLRLNIFPDGGISRVRVHGRVAAENS